MAAPITTDSTIFRGVGLLVDGLTDGTVVDGVGLNTFGFIWPADAIWVDCMPDATVTWNEC